ncbi:MAG TPA: histidine phosphatase family protein [Bacteroidales bacterium]|nr:histidine phosphatase family protein [Bacteroidales bacterium]
MKRIILMRHGQAEEGADGIPDFERSLTTKGKNISRFMARKLRERISNPGILITSPAFRAFETALVFAGEYGIKPEEIILKSQIYSRFNHEVVMEILKGIGEETETVTFFGHNPNFSSLASYYARGQADSIAKSGIVSITFNIMIWSDIRPSSGTIELSFEPKKIL